MKRKSVDSNLERQFLIALVTSKPFLAAAVPGLDDLSVLSSEHYRQVAQWCVDYFRQYDEAPGKNIEPLYHAWAESHKADRGDLFDVQVEAVHDLLEFISTQYDSSGELNTAYLVDEFNSYLQTRHLVRLNEDLSLALSNGDAKQAREKLTDFAPVEIGQGVGFNPLSDRGAWEEAFASPAECLIPFHGPAGDFFNHALTRDALIGIQGPEKRGKTWWCIEFLMRALMAHRKVAFFEVGDLTTRQVMLRLGVRLATVPLWRKHCDGPILVPRKIETLAKGSYEPDDLKVKVESDSRSFKNPLDYREARRACKKFMRRHGIHPDKPSFMVSVHPNSSINVNGIEGILKRWRQELEFIPDVVIIDYADILAPEDSRIDFRHQVNETWKALRRLSQVWHCLVLAPTQANASSYKADTQTMQNFSEDKRKLAHVTGMLGLNQNRVEKEAGVMRLNWIVLREADFQAGQCLWVGQCIQLGRAFCCGAL